MNNYAAIDWSMSSPAMAIGSSANPDDLLFFGVKTKKKHFSIQNFHLYEPVTDYENDIDRFSRLAKPFIVALVSHNVKTVFMEGYAYGANGNTFSIGESTGVLKYMLWKAGIDYVIVQPGTIKKHHTGKGNANKNLMYDAYVESTGQDMIALLGEHRGANIPAPVNDLVDAYAILQVGISLQAS